MKVGDSVIYENWKNGTFAKAIVRSFVPNPRPTVNLTLEDGSYVNGIRVDTLLGATGADLRHDVEAAKHR